MGRFIFWTWVLAVMLGVLGVWQSITDVGIVKAHILRENDNFNTAARQPRFTHFWRSHRRGGVNSWLKKLGVTSNETSSLRPKNEYQKYKDCKAQGKPDVSVNNCGNKKKVLSDMYFYYNAVEDKCFNMTLFHCGKPPKSNNLFWTKLECNDIMHTCRQDALQKERSRTG